MDAQDTGYRMNDKGFLIKNVFWEFYCDIKIVVNRNNVILLWFNCVHWCVNVTDSDVFDIIVYRKSVWLHNIFYQIYL